MSVAGVLQREFRKDFVKYRICIYCIALTHMVGVGFYLVTIDFNALEDLELRKYEHHKWKLLTTWFNLIFMAYLPVNIYCDWRKLRGEEIKHIGLINKIRSLCFSSILLPNTLAADLIFWGFWHKDRHLLIPKALENTVPFWTQHCMHTVSIFLVILELIVLVPRRRPKSMMSGIIVLTIFSCTYSTVFACSFMSGEYIYPFLKLFSDLQFALFLIGVYVGELVFYLCQWFVVDLVWYFKLKVKKIN